MRSTRNRKTDALVSARENLRHSLRITTLSIAKRAAPISPTRQLGNPMRTGRALPALDMQAQAIITAPMTKTKSFSSNFLLAEGCVTLLAGAFQFEMGMLFRRVHHEMDCRTQ